MAYFPSTYPKGKSAPRDYFFNILNTIHPDYLAQVMAHANKQRMSAEGEAQAAQRIQISEYWQEQLASMPYLSRKSIFICITNHLITVIQRRMARLYTC